MDVDNEEDNGDFAFDSLTVERIDINWIREQSDKIGKTNKDYNEFEAILKECDKMEVFGLDPVVVYSSAFQGYMVTSEQVINRQVN